MEIEKNVVVFDFDKTLVPHDTGYEFIKSLFCRNPLRMISALIVSPFTFVFYLSPGWQYIGNSVFLWLATVGLPVRSLFHARKRFLSKYFSKNRTIAHADGMRKLKEHIELGHSVFILSGTFSWILTYFLKQSGIKKCEVIGSVEKMFCKGIVYRQHCYAANKVRLLKLEMMTGADDILAGYTDSAADIPLLSLCKSRYLVNPTRRTVKKYRDAFGDDFVILDWH